MLYEAYAMAEWDLMGSILVEPAQTLKEVRNVVSVADFANDAPKAVYEAVIELVDSGAVVDATIIFDHLEKRGTPITKAQAVEAMQQRCTIANAPVTAEIVHTAAMRRAAADVGLTLADGSCAIDEAIAKLQELNQTQNSKVLTEFDAAQAYADYIDDISAGKVKPFISTGFTALDGKLEGGFAQSGLITLAARPGTGKTTAALNLAERVAEQGEKVLYVSLEMDSNQLWSRRVAAYSGLSYAHVNRADLNDGQWKRWSMAMEVLSPRPFRIYDKPCTVDDIERMARVEEPALLVIDHIGLIRNSTGRSRYEQMTDVSHRLKQLALSLGIPILALCQLNRQSEGRESKIPTIADLRDTGAIEEDSDVVMLLHRPAMYASGDDAPQPWESHELQFIVGKNRHGMQGIVRLEFNGVTARITELSA